MFTSRRITMGGDVFRDEYSLAFDGSNDYVELSGTFSYNVHSISMWVNPAAESGAMSLFDYRDANNDGIHIYLADGDVIYQIDNTDGHYDTKLALNQWHHIVCTNDGSTSTIYVNGVSVETADTSGETINVSGSAVPRIGARSHTSPSNYFQGNISEVAIYNSALTANQAKTIYNGREPYNHKEGVASGDLKAWWRMGDGARDGFSKTLSGLTGDGAGLIQDIASDITYTDLVTGWTNGDFDTLTTSGLDVSSAISDGSASHEFYSNEINITAGDIVEVSFTIAGSLIPSSDLKFKLAPASNLNSAQFESNITAAGNYHFFAQWTVTDSTSFVGIRAASEACNFSMTNFSCKRIAGGNNGCMLNMAAEDFVGDTP